MKEGMETSMYKELSYRARSFRVVTCIIAAVTVVLCLLIGIGTWILVSGVRENEKYLNTVREHDITIIEGEIREPLRVGPKSNVNGIDKVVSQIAEIDFKEGSPKNVDQPEIPPVALLQNAPGRAGASASSQSAQPVYVDPRAYKTSFSQRYVVKPSKEEISAEEVEENIEGMEPVQRQKKSPLPLLSTIVSFANNVLGEQDVINNPNYEYVERTFRSLRDYANQFLGYEEYQEPATHRISKRAIAPMMIGNAVKYFSYAAFAKFMYNEASAITEYKIESRKLSGDPEASFLDNLFWSKPDPQKPSRIDIVDPSISQEILETPNKPLLYGSDGWTPMVNQVSLSFISELLNTLLKVMREFLLRDHVMECLWFMFCQDVNHQAKYGDIYGVMARVNR